MTAYINIKGDKSESEKKKKYIFILFKNNQKGFNKIYYKKKKTVWGGKQGFT